MNNNLVYAALCFSIILMTAFAGYKLGSASCESSKLKSVARAIDQANKQAAIDAQITEAAALNQARALNAHRVIIKRVTHHVMANADYDSCRIDLVGMCYANAAARGSDGAECSGGVDAPVPAARKAGKQ